jgi:hypothetical protein
LGADTRHDQYAALAAAHAPRFGLITSDVRQASEWMTKQH